MRKVSTPTPLYAARASPESFRSTRLKIGSGIYSILARGAMRNAGFKVPRRIRKPWNLGTSVRNPKSAPFGAPELLSLWFRLGDGNRLAGVADFKSCEPQHRDVL